MRVTPGNPITNRPSPGLTDEQLEAAVLKSGYPLQRVVAAELKKSFTHVVEEWSYVDRETKDQRALDVYAFRGLTPDSPDLKVQPGLILLVECKRAELPHVFFKTAVDAQVDEFPRVLGLPRWSIPLVNSIGKTRHVPLAVALGLKDEAFLAGGPPICTSFSQVVRKGKHLVLSGANPFRRIFLPLISALTHAIEYHKPAGSRAENYWAHMTLCVAVIDGPMIAAESDPESPELCLQPWVRVIKHEILNPSERTSRRRTYYAVDVVHREFLPTFVQQHLLPFARTFAERVERMHRVLYNGQGFVPDLETWSWADVQADKPK